MVTLSGKELKYEIVSLMREVKSDKEGEAERLNAKLEEYKKDQEVLKAEAEKTEKESEFHLDRHATLARSVTIFQISIAISAIAMLTRRKALWYGSMAFSIIGLVLFVMGVR